MGVRRRVLVLVNPKSGVWWPFEGLRRAFDRCWEVEGTDLRYQFCQDRADGTRKARQAADEGVSTVLVVGGDGTVSSIGRELIGTDTSLGIVPTGSGNGLARHFGIPLWPERAVRILAGAVEKRIDVGVVNDTPFLVTCSMAWDASVVRSFERMPVRGILPYVFAGAQELIGYVPQEMRVKTDSGESMVFPDPLVFTIANLTQYGGGAKIAPRARPDDGKLELVVALRQDIAILIANIGRLFDGSIDTLPEVVSKTFQSLVVTRPDPAPIQVDGELVDASSEVRVRVMPEALKVLVPA